MKFLQCAAESPARTNCNSIGASKSGFSNPFTNNEANGIFLRLPWCAFQVAAAPGQKSIGTPGECHYTLRGDSGKGAYVAGAFTTTGEPQLAGQASTDLEIDNLSNCQNVVYDTCNSSVLGRALNYIATISANATSPLRLSIGLESGQYTPRSVLDAKGSGYVGYVDLPKVNSHHAQTFCTRQPLAWQPNYARYYTNALRELAQFIRRPGFTAPPIAILKQGAITANTTEFDVPATTTVAGYQTAIDPALPLLAGGNGNGTGPQGDAALQCPDQTLFLSGVGALLNQYALAGIPGETMANAYEATFGYIVGFESGMLAQGNVPDAIISVATKGSQDFAHVACGTDGNSPCIPDPNPMRGPQFAWSEYYFTKFVNDLFVPGSKAYVSATSAFVDACRGKSCAQPSYNLTPWQLALVYTGLVATDTGDEYTWVPTCWLNNTNVAPSVYTTPSTLELYTAPAPNLLSTTVVVLGPVGSAGAPSGGTMLGWQTRTSSGAGCQTGAYTLQGGIRNGGQFIEIQTDAAAEPTCVTPLRQTLSHMLGPNTNYNCEYYSSSIPTTPTP